MNSQTFDAIIIGGGINGCAIAAEFAMQGLRVAVCEQNDLASGTSSMSSKLIHGGLRYLEQYDFKLVQHALAEREILLNRAPHLVLPQEFILPYTKQNKPYWLIQLGLYLYDWLSPSKRLPKSKRVYFRKHLSQYTLQNKYSKGFSYYDCATDDARLVIANAQLAKEFGAEILPYRKVMNCHFENDAWRVQIFNQHTQKERTLNAKLIINATGPWHNEFLALQHLPTNESASLVQGSHFIIKKFYTGQQAYIFQTTDKRVIFAIPLEQDYLLIGTTEMPYQGNPQYCKITQPEIDYLCYEVNQYFHKQIKSTDIIWDYAGVRPLISASNQDMHALSRDFHISLNHTQTNGPFIDIIGGKITTHRLLAESVFQKCMHLFPNALHKSSKTVALPGGEFGFAGLVDFKKQIHQQYAWLPKNLLHRYIHYYGSAIHRLLADCQQLSDLGQYYGHGLYQCEIEYLITNEWAYSVDDILYRRTKLGLRFDAGQKQKLAELLTAIFQ